MTELTAKEAFLLAQTNDDLTGCERSVRGQYVIEEFGPYIIEQIESSAHLGGYEVLIYFDKIKSTDKKRFEKISPPELQVIIRWLISLGHFITYRPEETYGEGCCQCIGDYDGQCSQGPFLGINNDGMVVSWLAADCVRPNSR